MRITIFDKNLGPHYLGMLPHWLNEADPRPASEQLDSNYQHGGGWSPFNGFKLLEDNSIKYPGDPKHKPLAQIEFRNELVIVYESSWVGIINPNDRTFEVCRMD